MHGPEMTRAEAARLHHDDVVAILLDQHAQIQELFAEVRRHGADAPAKKRAFDDLRRLLAVHEAAEEMVVRPAARKVAGASETDARDREEKHAATALAELEAIDVNSAAFDAKFADLERALESHARLEERQEFPSVRDGYSPAERCTMGVLVRSADKFAPAHPPPGAAGSTTAPRAAGPFAGMLDRAKDTLRRD